MSNTVLVSPRELVAFLEDNVREDGIIKILGTLRSLIWGNRKDYS